MCRGDGTNPAIECADHRREAIDQGELCFGGGLDPLPTLLAQQLLPREAQPSLVQLGVDATNEPGALANQGGAVSDQARQTLDRWP